MARAFKRRGDRLVGRFDPVERGIVAGLMDQTRDLLAPPDREPTGDAFEDLVAGLGVSLSAADQAPDDVGDLDRRDPALDRLLPTAHRGDEQVAAEFRRLTEHGLRDRKATNLATSVAVLRAASGDRLSLTRGQAQAMLVALTDTRLLLGERLGLRTLVTDTIMVDPASRARVAGEVLDFAASLAGVAR